ncbi:MAG: homoserine kinase [Ignavibacteriae bacterium]|nr:homoserine kinase [Ignavibacteria bacterium]MBI3363363.1 homoserine kinase [Ignavibacteriota bacterium]
MKQKSVRVYAPASISNLGPGFDVLGLAIDRPGDYATARRTDEPGLHFSIRTEHDGIPSSAKENVAGHVASLMLEEFKPPFGVDLLLEKKMPLGSGLGSSGASSVAAAAALNVLLPKSLKKTDLLRFVVEGERKASGSPHADNVAPSLLGGACLIRSYDPLDVIQLPIRNTIVWIIVHPHVVVRTQEARDVLPTSIPLTAAIRQWGNVSGVTAGLLAGDIRLLGKCIEDVIVEPVRARFIPGFDEVKRAALDAGAYGCSISGSGPSMFAIAHTRIAGTMIGRAMVTAFRRHGNIHCDTYISHVNMHGAKIVWTKER